jgi:hypothetical protein
MTKEVFLTHTYLFGKLSDVFSNNLRKFHVTRHKNKAKCIAGLNKKLGLCTYNAGASFFFNVSM